MTDYDFTFIVDDLDITNDAHLDRLFEAGCDDATPALIHGALAICFTRQAESYYEAVMSAMDNLQAAGADVQAFEPDFLVTASEIASRSGLTRQAISLYEKGERAAHYPAPVRRVSSSSPLWDWVDVSRWLHAQGKLPEEAVREAQISRVVNALAQVKETPEKIKDYLLKVLSAPLPAA